MSNTVLHKTQSAVGDLGVSGEVSPNEWNEEHSFSGGANGAVLYRNSSNSDGAGWSNSLPSGNGFGFGAAATTSTIVHIGGSWSGTPQAEGLKVAPTLNGVVGAHTFGVVIGPTIVEAASGTHLSATALYVSMTATAGAGNTANANAIYCATWNATNHNGDGNLTAAAVRAESPTGASRNYAFLAESFDQVGLCIRSASSVSHGLSSGGSFAQSGYDYFNIAKYSNSFGGAIIQATAEDAATYPLRIAAYGGTATTTIDGTTAALFQFYVSEHDGANTLDTSAAAGSLLYGFYRRSSGAWRMAVGIDAEGDLHVDGSASLTTFDAWDDAALARALDRHRAPDQVIRSQWDDFVQYNEDDLVEAGVLSAPSVDGRHVVNITQLQRLHNGALWQLSCRQRELQAALDGVTAKLNALTN